MKLVYSLLATFDVEKGKFIDQAAGDQSITIAK